MLMRKLVWTAWSYKSQFLSMILMIAIGIGVFLGFHMEWHSIETDTSEFFKETNYADFRMYSDTGFTTEDIKKIQEMDGVKEATRFLSVNVGLKDSKKSVTLHVSEDYSVSTMLITSGAEYEADSEGIWLSDQFAEANQIAIGDSLTFVYQGMEISGDVVGLAKSGEEMICVADSNQLMPDYNTHGFAYITPKKLERSVGTAFYPQINLISDMDKATLEENVKDTLGTTIQITDKELHTAYAGAKSEAEEGKTMGSVLPVLFLAIAILTMITTMHRIAANEKVQIGMLKALGFRDRKILLHYTSYGLVIGLLGSILGIALGYGIVSLIMSPNGMMATYFDLPEWKLTMPVFCIPVIVVTVAFLTLISCLSTRKMLQGTAADALRPYEPKAMRKSKVENLSIWKKLPFSVKWNARDILRHKARSGMTLLGVFGCMLLMVGGLGMRDTMQEFLRIMGEDVNHYTTKIAVSETADNQEAEALCGQVQGDWQASTGISYEGNTIALDIYHIEQDHIRFLTEENEMFTLGDEGVYLCLRQKDTAKIGDTISFSPYGSEKTYRVKVAGYFRSLVSECIVMTDSYADSIGLEYHINAIYTKEAAEDISHSAVISGKQDKDTMMESYDTFMELLNLMIGILIFAAVVLGVVVLYNLGIMSYVERRRELATLKVLGFRDKAIGRLLISQNMWLTAIGVLLGLPGGYLVLYILLTALAGEYELSITMGIVTYVVSVLLTFGVSFLVGVMVSGKSKKIDMVEALKRGLL